MFLLHKLTVFYRDFGHWEMLEQNTWALISIFSQSAVAMSFAIFAPNLVFSSPLCRLSFKAQNISENGLNSSFYSDLFWYYRDYVSWRACALRLCKLLSTVKILLFLTCDFLHVLCHVQGSEFREVNKRNGFR